MLKHSLPLFFIIYVINSSSILASAQDDSEINDLFSDSKPLVVGHDEYQKKPSKKHKKSCEPPPWRYHKHKTMDEYSYSNFKKNIRTKTMDYKRVPFNPLYLWGKGRSKITKNEFLKKHKDMKSYIKVKLFQCLLNDKAIKNGSTRKPLFHEEKHETKTIYPWIEENESDSCIVEIDDKKTTYDVYYASGEHKTFNKKDENKVGSYLIGNSDKIKSNIEKTFKNYAKDLSVAAWMADNIDFYISSIYQ